MLTDQSNKEQLRKQEDEAGGGGVNVKEDTGCKAVFAEQRASALQMNVANVLDTLCRLPGMFAEANDAGSACDRCPTNWHKISDPVVSLASNFFGHPKACHLCERKLEEI